MRRIGQQPTLGTQERLLTVHQRLDALGGVVEAVRQCGHLILTGHLGPHPQIARSLRIHRSLQRFQPTGDAPRDRPGRQPHRHKEQGQRQRCTDGQLRRRGAPCADQQRAIVRQRHTMDDGHHRAPGPLPVTGLAMAALRVTRMKGLARGQRRIQSGRGRHLFQAGLFFLPRPGIVRSEGTAGGGQHPALRVDHLQVDAQATLPVPQRLLQSLHAFGGRGDHLGCQGLGETVLLRLGPVVQPPLPEKGHRGGHQQQAGQQRQEDGQGQATHGYLYIERDRMAEAAAPSIRRGRCAAARTHSPRRARSADARADGDRPRWPDGSCPHARRWNGRRPPGASP